MTRILCFTVTAMLCILYGDVKSQARKAELPNIIIILPDDLGWSDVGYNGSVIRTPNIDRLAKTGIRLDQHYVMPTCTPTRVALITGKYPSRYGVLGPAYGEVIYQGEPTMASILGKGGYDTYIAGKWHMGSPPHTPRKYGFEHSYGYFDGQIDPYTHKYKTGPDSWHRDDVLFQEQGHATDLITREAVRVIESKGRRPFFLYVAYSVPHYPLDEPEEWTSQYDHLNLHPSRKLFAASVTHMDDGIGDIMEALDRTGQRANTLIIFVSDNGGQQAWRSDTEYGGRYADRPHDVLGNNFPLRGWKVDLYEGGIRVPTIVNWPGRLDAGVSDTPLHVTDWLPTLAYLTGMHERTEKLTLDGRNIWRQLTGEQSADENRTMYWKTAHASAVRQGSWKLLSFSSGATELYNLADDFRETRELSKKEPARTAAMLKLLQEFEAGDRR